MSKHKTTNKVDRDIRIPKPQRPKKQDKRFPIPQEELESLRKLSNKKIVFSFRFIELNHEAFNLTGTCYKWSNDLFKLLKELSDISRNEFVNDLQEHYRCHIHDWSKLKYKFDFDDDFLEQVECRQARISSSKGGIHGFVIGNMFYVVWLDPQHNLYPDDAYGGLKILKPPDTCCGYRDRELAKLKEENKELKELIESCTEPEST